MSHDWQHWINEIQHIAEDSLSASEDEFDKQRFRRLIELSHEMRQIAQVMRLEEIIHPFHLLPVTITPKVDVRSFVMQDGRIMLVRERADNLWSLPGGFADVNESPSFSVVRETQEESGFVVKVKRLLAVWDPLKHDHPLPRQHVYKCIFHCEIVDGKAQENLEVSAIDFFDLQALPNLSTPRITQRQLFQLHDYVMNHQVTQFD